MIFGRSRQKKKSRHLLLRVQNCVDTILDLNERLGEGKIRPEIIKQFERLKTSLQSMTDESVNEDDTDRIEEATNQLLAEIRESHGEESSHIIREGSVH